MCGISAIVNLARISGRQSGQSGTSEASGEDKAPNRNRARLTQQMKASLHEIRHRGPDFAGIWISEGEQVVLGHTRLSINDLSEDGNQPLHSADGTIHAIVNGELYDFEKIKTKLTAETGHKFASNSDSEIVIALYQNYGLDFVQHLRGEFAICLYDEARDVFIAARDRYGIKPLFYTMQDERLLMAAEIKAFTPLGWQPEWDVKSIVEAGWNFDDRTLFRDVKKLRPGHIMTCNAVGEIKDQKYWDIEYPDKHVRDERSEMELIEGVRSRLIEAVRIRLRADIPVGVYLSGGVDSSAIAGLVTHLAREQGVTLGSLSAEERINCFCVAFDKTSGFDESKVAERTAEWLGIKLHKQVMDEEGFAARFENATWHCEHHNPDLNYIGKFALSELPQELGFRSILTGEGADEIFTGYGIYLPDILREADLTWQATIPEEERQQLFEKSEAETSAYYKSEGAAELTNDMPEGRRKLNGITTAGSMAAFIPDVFDSWTSLLHPRNPQDVIADDVTVPVLEKMQQQWHPANTAQYVWTKGHLPNIFMSCLGDRTEMAHSIEGRTPFLDHHLTEYANTIPPSLKMRWTGNIDSVEGGFERTQNKLQQNPQFTAKWILREAMRPFITQEIYERVKHPYTAPVAYEVDGPLHQLLGRLITEEKVRQLGFVSWEKASTLVKRAFEDREAAAMRLAFCVAQWVVLAERFGVKMAVPPSG